VHDADGQPGVDATTFASPIVDLKAKPPLSTAGGAASWMAGARRCANADKARQTPAIRAKNNDAL
jgi:hypothetical protein